MPPRQGKVDNLSEVAAAVVADNPQIRERIERLVNGLLADAEHILRFGSSSERANLMRTIVPSLLRSMQNADASTSEQAQREAYDRMREQMRGDTPIALPEA